MALRKKKRVKGYWRKCHPSCWAWITPTLRYVSNEALPYSTRVVVRRGTEYYATFNTSMADRSSELGPFTLLEEAQAIARRGNLKTLLQFKKAAYTT